MARRSSETNRLSGHKPRTLAHETNDIDFEIREHLYGVGRKKTHHILYRIVENTVEVLAVRHVAQQDFDTDDL